MQARIDQVFSGNQQAVAEERAGWQRGENEMAVAVVEADGEVDAVAEDTVGTDEQGAVREYFPQRAEGDEDAGESRTHRRAVNGGGQYRVFRRVAFGAGDDDAVGDDQREVDAKRLVERVGQRLDEDFDDGDGARNQQDEDGDADFRAQPAAGGSDEDVRQRQDEDGRHAEAEGVDGVGRGGEQRAEAEDLHQGGVVVPEAVGEGFTGFGGHGFCDWIGDAGLCGGCPRLCGAGRSGEV